VLRNNRHPIYVAEMGQANCLRRNLIRVIIRLLSIDLIRHPVLTLDVDGIVNWKAPMVQTLLRKSAMNAFN
jgi:hypothetical protein